MSIEAPYMSRQAAAVLSIALLFYSTCTMGTFSRMDAANAIPRQNRNDKKMPHAARPDLGKKVYINNGCATCHKIAGNGGMGGPDLSNEGARPGRTIAFLKKVVVTPEILHKPSLMPPCTTLKPDELADLCAYLASLKKNKKQ